jgi:hypothetical protein
MPLVLQGATSGQATVQATDAATVTLTLPATSGTLVVTGGAQTIEFADGSASAPSITNSGDTNTGIFFPAADTIAFTEGGTESMRIDSSGNAGIGTTSPATKLHVNQGNVSADTYVQRISWGDTSGTNKGLLGFYSNNGSDTRGFIGADNNGVLYLGENGGGGIRFLTGGPSGTERMRIDSSGNVGIGQTSPGGKLEVNQTDNSGVCIVARYSGTGGLIGENYATNGSYTGPGLRVRAARNTSNGSYQVISYYNDSGAYRLFVQDSGNVQNTNNSYGGLSDAKLKENIVDATPKLNDLMNVKVRHYNLKSDQTHKQIGVVAQELEEVFPSLVEEFSDKDEDGNELGTVTKTVKYSVFVPMLIKAIQELNAKVDAQAARIAVLEGAK